jgi:hypothetical protein
MKKLILATTILAIAGVAPVFARNGHGHHRGHVSRASATPANPSSQAAHPPAQVSEKEKMDPEDAALDKRIKSICKGC